jgi:hypothetical protein
MSRLRASGVEFRRAAKAGEFGRVALLMGGASAEREVSLMTGKAVLEALIAASPQRFRGIRHRAAWVDGGRPSATPPRHEATSKSVPATLRLRSSWPTWIRWPMSSST